MTATETRKINVGDTVRILKGDKQRGPAFDTDGNTGRVTRVCEPGGYHVDVNGSVRHYGNDNVRALYKKGDVLVITRAKLYSERWNGLKVEALRDETVYDNLYVKPLSDRPDHEVLYEGEKRHPFNWPADELDPTTRDDDTDVLPNTREGVDAAVKDVDAAMLRLDEYRRKLVDHKRTLAVAAPGRYKLIVVPIYAERTGDEVHVFYTDGDGDYFHTQGGDKMRALFDDDEDGMSWRTHAEMAERFGAIREGRFNVIDREELNFHHHW